ncbi:DUF7553 family protein [Halorarius litoreus]|uniref:DUF7553 family protein n=1 Tax=Halorarius litoreus TaxID=2962676 RepID=UPI0020CB7E73|nr:hypothetical protein [Halorarius litoreus]
MNKHFEDSTYYMKRAGETARAGVAEELETIEARIREMTGREKEVEQGRLDELKAELKELQERAEGDAREAIAEARERLEAYRAQEA